MADFEYDAIQTCAADGTCQSVCPVAIDTGELMKEFRRRERTDREEAIALAAGQALRDRRARDPRRARPARAPPPALLGDRTARAGFPSGSGGG